MDADGRVDGAGLHHRWASHRNQIRGLVLGGWGRTDRSVIRQSELFDSAHSGAGTWRMGRDLRPELQLADVAAERRRRDVVWPGFGLRAGLDTASGVVAAGD